MKATFEVLRTRDDGWIFQLKIGGHQVVLHSNTYRTLAGCLNGVESCREHSPYDRFYGRGEDHVRFTFHVKASNNRIIGLGCVSASAAEREIAIGLVKRCVQDARTLIARTGDEKK